MVSAVERIEAALDEAEKRLDEATPPPWIAEYSKPTGVCIIDSESHDARDSVARLTHFRDHADSRLIVSVVNRERAQIQHARDVLARHRPEMTRNGPTGKCGWCALVLGGVGAYANYPCPEVASLLAVWCSEPGDD
jgi:hypothetical protein